MTLLLVVLGLLCLEYAVALDCLSCDHAASIAECHNVPCAANEKCFMDEVIDDLGLFYRGGCRARDVCNAAASSVPSGKRSSSSEFVACARCCDAPPDNSTSPPCNSKLCGFPSTLPGGKDLGTCYSCHDVHDVNDCNGFTTCQHDEVCGVTFKAVPGQPDPLHSMGCFQRAKCTLATRTVIALADHYGGFGRRSTFGCTTCCGDSFCNTGTCKNLAEKLYKLYKAGKLDLDTLKMI